MYVPTRARTGTSYSQIPNENEETGDFLVRQIKMQNNLVEEQDTDLELMADGVGRLGEMALEIGREIEMQNKCVDLQQLNIKYHSDTAPSVLPVQNDLRTR